VVRGTAHLRTRVDIDLESRLLKLDGLLAARERIAAARACRSALFRKAASCAAPVSSTCSGGSHLVQGYSLPRKHRSCVDGPRTHIRTYQKQTLLSTMSPLPRISLPASLQSARQGKTFPAVVRKSARKSLILQDSIPEIEKSPCYPVAGGKFGHSPDGRRLAGRHGLVSPPRLRYISPSVGGV
jgi:hypothetical protein